MQRGWIIALSLSLVGVAPVRGAVDYDGFSYSGPTLNGQNGGSNWNGGWVAAGSSPSLNLSDDGASLTYPGLVPGAGSRISTAAPAANAASTRLLSGTYDLGVGGTTIYTSALVRKQTENGSATDNILVQFFDAVGNRRFGFGVQGSNDAPWLNANGSTTAANAVAAGDTYFIVAKLVAGAGGSQASGGVADQAWLWVFGTNYRGEVTATEPVTADATLTQFTAAVLDRVTVRIDTANTAAGEVDELRVGSTWSDVVAVPEPSSLALLGLAGLMLARRRGRRHCGRD